MQRTVLIKQYINEQFFSVYKIKDVSFDDTGILFHFFGILS